MPNRILLIVEGKKTEPNIFESVFSRYGFDCCVAGQKLNVIDGTIQFDKYIYENHNNKSNIVFIFEGPRNRIHDFLVLLSEPYNSIEKALSFYPNFFQKIFLLYDVDHNDCDDIKKMSETFRDEYSGMLLLSSPCIEVLGDYNLNRNEEQFTHLSKYKKIINKHYNGKTIDYIKKNFESIMLYFLEKNRKDFDDTNIMEHPRKIVEWINKLNTRVNFPQKYVIYRYFSTVVYVAIASALSLTKKIDNYDLVKSFFESKLNESIK